MNKRIKKKKNKLREGYKWINSFYIVEDIKRVKEKYPELNLFERNYVRWRFYLKRWKVHKHYSCFGSNIEKYLK